MSARAVFLTVAVMSAVLPVTLSDTPTTPPRFKLDLGQPPEHRWDKILVKYRQAAGDIMKILREKFGPNAVKYLEFIGQRLETYIKEPFAGEIRGIARVLNSKVEDIVLMNLFYEMSAYCTSIVVQDVKGQIFHGRNLDYSYTDIFRNVTMVVDFQRRNKTAYTGTLFGGSVGLFTGQTPNSVTISLDERHHGGLWENVLTALLDRKSRVGSFMIREILEANMTFHRAVQEIATSATIADAYYIVGGVRSGEGAVVTANHLGAADVWFINSTADKWFLVETNYDHWTTPPPSDDRRDPAIKALRAIGQNKVNGDGVFSVLSVHPVHNNRTIYTNIMSAKQPSLYYARVRQYP